MSLKNDKSQNQIYVKIFKKFLRENYWDATQSTFKKTLKNLGIVCDQILFIEFS
jgi:uncharacterized protein YnzC (UPF0291/DUF896 family)